MRSFALVLLFVALVAFCWGVYGPTLHHGQHDLGDEAGNPSLWRPFLLVGAAYFLIAVLTPLAVLYTWGEKGRWTFVGSLWSLAAGTAGACGALGIISAFTFRGNPLYVMPLVFGGAPVVNTLYTMNANRSFRQAGAVFYLGILLAALGASGVMIFKPGKPKLSSVVFSETDGAITVVETKKAAGKEQVTTWGPDSLENFQSRPDLAGGYKLYRDALPFSFTEWLMIPASILLTIVSWGCYGPVLHQGQAKMEGSRWRPFLCVGLAYFAIAVIVPVMVLGVIREPGDWHYSGVLWSLAGGAAGAIGALGIIMAFNFGGKPIYVMPLVFGIAPVVNTFVTIWERGQFADVSTLFIGSLAVVIAGAGLVLVFAPKAAPHDKPSADKTPPNQAPEKGSSQLDAAPASS